MANEMIENFTNAIGVDYIKFAFAFLIVCFMVYIFIYNFTHRFK